MIAILQKTCLRTAFIEENVHYFAEITNPELSIIISHMDATWDPFY